MIPPFPIITIYREKGVDILNGEYPLDKTSLFGYVKHDSNDTIYYDKEGFKWTSSVFSQKHKRTFLTKLLASTIYNPTVKIERTWTKVRRYELSELISKVNRCIDLDDDILTQFVDAVELKTKVSQAGSFDALAKLLFDYVFKPNPEVIEKIV